MPTLVETHTAHDAHDIVTAMSSSSVPQSLEAQAAWAGSAICDRLQVIKRARNFLATKTDLLCAAIPEELARNAADTMCAEILPLLAALKFLEKDAEAILRARPVGKQGRPIWLMGLLSEVRRVPLGRVLVIAPSNYPLFLPGVQVAQALVAGNAVIWKPGAGGRKVAILFAEAMQDAGLPSGLLTVTDESIGAATRAIGDGVDKVFFTGSASSGRALMTKLSETLTPCVAELSGCDAVFVLPSADLSRVVKAFVFGMRLNGSATCMAPRRIIMVAANKNRNEEFVSSLVTALRGVDRVRLSGRVRGELESLLAEASASGARVHGELTDLQRPLLVSGVTPSMRIGQADIFAPLLMLMGASSTADALKYNQACPYALTAAIFGREREALELANQVTAGTVIVNDLMVPAADPRTPFGGRKSSGFGVTQGAEGLLEMTTPKTVAVRRGRNTSYYDVTTPKHARLFRGIIHASHLAGGRARMLGLKHAISAAIDLRGRN